MSEVKPLVAIHCLVYNHEPYLRDCFEGFVMQQTNFPFVAIVHDDASTDGSAAIIREYEKKYPKIFKPIYETDNLYQKGGFCAIDKVMNDAINASGAKYVAMCEGDDYWTDPLKLQKQVNFLEKATEYSMCFHEAEIKLQGVNCGKCGIRCEHIQNKEYSSTELFAQWIVPTASIVYDVKKINKYSIKHPEWVTRGDIILVLKCSHVGKVWGMSDQMSVYRVQPNSVSHNPKYRSPEIYKLPNHFKCIYQSFHKLVKEPIIWNISHSYYSRMKSNTSIGSKICDFICFVFWNPKYAYSKIKDLTIKKIIYHHE